MQELVQGLPLSQWGGAQPLPPPLRAPCGQLGGTAPGWSFAEGRGFSFMAPQRGNLHRGRGTCGDWLVMGLWGAL